MADVIEIGAARTEELEPILELMCEAFEMPYAAAQKIYYADPYLDPNDKRVVRLNGKVVACLTIVEIDCSVGAAVVRMGGIAGLATVAPHRRQGYAKMLLVDTVQALADRGCALAALFPFSRDYYRRLGWETCSHIWQCRIAPAELRASAQKHIRPAVSTDIPQLNRLYSHHSTGRSLYCLRDAKRWAYLLGRLHGSAVFEPVPGALEGYLLYDTLHGVPALGQQTESLPGLRILELVASSDAATRGLNAYLHSLPGVHRISWDGNLDDFGASGILSAGRGFGGDQSRIHLDLAEGVMVRLVDFKAVLNALKPAWEGFNGTLAARLEDPQRDPSARTFRISGDGSGQPQITELYDGEAASMPELVTASVPLWSQIVTGYVSGAELVRQNPSATDRTFASLEWLFPERTPFFPPLDHF